MADVIARLRVDSQEYDRKIGQSKNKLKEFEKSGTDASKALNDFAGKMGVSIPKLGAMSVAVGAVSAALAVAKDAFSQSESAMDEWDRTVAGAKGAYDMFLQSINTGDWSNFFDRLNEAIRGARELNDALDNLGSVKANNQAAIAITQQSIQQLRLRKENGENVDSELAAATARLASLQRQEVDAGITAGSKTMIEALKNAGIEESVATTLADELVNGGQEAFNKYAAKLEELTNKATQGKYVRKLGGLISYYDENNFDINRLTKEEQELYAIASAVTEREAKLAEGISIYAQAVNAGTSSAREQIKNTKYGSSGSGSGGSSKVAGLTSEQIASNIADANDAMGLLIQNWLDLDQTIGNANSVQQFLNGESMSEWVDEPIDNLKELQKRMDDYRANIEDTAKANRIAAQTFGQVAGAIASIDNPAAKILGTLGQAIAQVALAYSESLAKDKTSKSSIWSFIAASTAATISMVSTIASIKSNARFADGGIVAGNNFSGDNVPIAVNSGELILNRAQQSSIASQLQQGSQGGGNAQPYVSGEQIWLGVNNYLKRTGRGELVTSR